MSLKLVIAFTAENGQRVYRETHYTDSPFLSTALKRAGEVMQDIDEWDIPDGVRWQKVDVSIEVDRTN